MAGARPVGLTRDAGWEVGVSRTVPHALDEVWRLLTSDEGLALWLGEGARLDPVRGSRYATADGTEGEVRGYREGNRIRLTWRPPGWSHDSTLQVAVTPGGAGPPCASTRSASPTPTSASASASAGGRS